MLVGRSRIPHHPHKIMARVRFSCFFSYSFLFSWLLHTHSGSLGDPGVDFQPSLGKDGVTHWQALAITDTPGFSNSPHVHVIGLWDEAGEPRENLYKQKETMTTQKTAPGPGSKPATFLEEQTLSSLWHAQQNLVAVKCEPLVFFKKEKHKRK